MRSVQSFEIDDNCIVNERLDANQLRFDQVIQLTHLRISFWNFNQCVHLLNQLGCQLHSLTMTLACIYDNEPCRTPKITSVSDRFSFSIPIN